mgnify:CR=1 FL=1
MHLLQRASDTRPDGLLAMLESSRGICCKGNKRYPKLQTATKEALLWIFDLFFLIYPQIRWFCGHFIVSGHKIALIVDQPGKMTIVQSVKMTYIFKGKGEVDCEAVEVTIAVE